MTPTELEIIANADAVEADLEANSTDVSNMTFEEFMEFCGREFGNIDKSHCRSIDDPTIWDDV